MSDPIAITRQLNRQRSPSRPGRAGTISPTNSFDPAFAPPFRRSSLTNTSQSPSNDVSSTPPEEFQIVCAEEVGKRLRTLSSSPNATLEILHLPPLLSLLPSHVARDLSVSPTPSPVEYTTSELPSITPLSRSLHRALQSLRPVTPLYAITPYHDSFNWSDLELQSLTREEIDTEREWYIVAFRSKRREGFTEEEKELLYRADREAHEEAIQAGGLLCYWYGSPLPITPPAAMLPRSTPSEDANTSKFDLAGRNLATCIWESRAAAILAMRGAKHKIAAQLASRSYESYTLERYLLRKDSGRTRVRVTEWEGRDVVGVEY